MVNTFVRRHGLRSLSELWKSGVIQSYKNPQISGSGFFIAKAVQVSQNPNIPKKNNKIIKTVLTGSVLFRINTFPDARELFEN